jgi:hypothetical protein
MELKLSDQTSSVLLPISCMKEQWTPMAGQKLNSMLSCGCVLYCRHGSVRAECDQQPLGVQRRKPLLFVSRARGGPG